MLAHVLTSSNYAELAGIQPVSAERWIRRRLDAGEPGFWWRDRSPVGEPLVTAERAAVELARRDGGPTPDLTETGLWVHVPEGTVPVPEPVAGEWRNRLDSAHLETAAYRAELAEQQLATLQADRDRLVGELTAAHNEIARLRSKVNAAMATMATMTDLAAEPVDAPPPTAR